MKAKVQVWARVHEIICWDAEECTKLSLRRISREKLRKSSCEGIIMIKWVEFNCENSHVLITHWKQDFQKVLAPDGTWTSTRISYTKQQLHLHWRILENFRVGIFRGPEYCKSSPKFCSIKPDWLYLNTIEERSINQHMKKHHSNFKYFFLMGRS